MTGEGIKAMHRYHGTQYDLPVNNIVTATKTDVNNGGICCFKKTVVRVHLEIDSDDTDCCLCCCCSDPTRKVIFFEHPDDDAVKRIMKHINDRFKKKEEDSMDAPNQEAM